jgi:hypothetical protein
MVSREIYSKHVYILQILCVLFSFPLAERETRLLVDFAAHPLHVFVLVLHARQLPLHAFAPALLVHLLLGVVEQDAQTLIPLLRTFYTSRVDIELMTIF